MDLEVVGRHALFFDDDAMAAFVNSADALVEWNSLKIDRYDVRHLLSAPPPQPRRSIPSLSHAIDSSLKSELDLERYLDLPPPSDEPEEGEDANAVNTSGYHAIPFSYGNSNDCAEQAGSAAGFENSGFRPPFSVPENLLQCLPPSEKDHQIIAKTAQFVSRHGGQSEIVLRVKQGDNPTFGFLMPDHYVHPYYRFLVDHQELLKSDGKPQNEERKDVNEPDGALSLLGSVYGSGEDEDAPNNMASNEAVDALSYTAQEKGESSANVPRQDEIISKYPPPSGSGLDKEKSHLLKKNPLISGSKNGSTSRKKLKDDSISASVSAALEKIKASGLGTFKIEPVVLEPPSDLKNLIGKIVEFIVKNGKQFEATLIEQDSKHGRFPFLLPSNMYHPYYLKVLHGAQESKVSGKSLHSGIDDSIGQGLEKRASLSKEGGTLPFGSGEGDVPYELDKKEKFKMVIGKSKKESQEPLDKGQLQEHGFSVDAAAAAAILQAAARGIKNPNIGILSKAAVNANSQGNTTDGSLGTITSSGHDNMTAGSRAIAKSNAEADSSETQLSKEQKLKAERLKKAKMFVAMLKNGAAPRGVSMEPPESGLSGSGTELNHHGEQREGSSAPLDGDVSDQGGRLKPGDEYNERRSMRKYRSRSGRHEVDEDGEGERKQQSTRKEHYSSMKNGGEESEDAKDHKRSKRKHHRSHYSDEDEASDKCEEERGHRHSRKKHHRSHHSDEDEASDKYEEERGHRHSRKKHHRSHDSDEDEHEASDKYEEERGHRHSRKKHRSHRTSNKYDDDEERDEENRRHSRKKHKSHRSHHSTHNKNKHKRLKEASDDEQHRHKSNKHSKGTAKREDLEEGEISGKVSDQSKGSLGGTISREASQDISSPRQRAPSEPSDDLRAKIRAMLMETRR
ncbi:protein suppressor of white apricot isoform X2 [Ipomoea triloba]|uniref:protein suppressor of white apricot isoform X2 n=1 Tax=Ipomoea triloba TaxID=35885 RepID=UPI00125E5A8A|nr:protein suppressor of white apricot isoform X2 [Ipomoea triloba]